MNALPYQGPPVGASGKPQHSILRPRASLCSSVDLLPPSARRVSHLSRGDGWHALADIEVFVFVVEAELEAMEQERIEVHCRGHKPDGTLRRRLIGLI
jgi:hypothetical protein